MQIDDNYNYQNKIHFKLLWLAVFVLVVLVGVCDWALWIIPKHTMIKNNSNL